MDWHRSRDLIALLQGKWEPAVLITLRAAGPTSSAHLRRVISLDLSYRMLRDTTGRLEAKALIKRIDHEPEHDVEYLLTANGQRVCGLLDLIDVWASRNGDLIEIMESGSTAWALSHRDTAD